MLITHYGCAYYRELLQHPPEDRIAAQMKDLRTGNQTLREWFPQLRVEAYFAMVRGRCFSFQQVNC